MNSRPFICGDKVSHYFHGEGTVDAIDPAYELKPIQTILPQGGTIKLCRVLWDNHSVTW